MDVDEIIRDSKLFPGVGVSRASVSFAGSAGLGQSSASAGARAPIAANVFPQAYNYFFGIWRRTPFDVFGEPLCLNGDGGGAHLHTFDCDRGQIWRIHPSQMHANGIYLECTETGASPNKYLAEDLGMVAEREAAALWTFEFAPPFRGGKNDIAIRVYNEQGLVLCSDPVNRRVLLLSSREADQRDTESQFAFNDAWEVTPDMDDVEVDLFLEKYLNEDYGLSSLQV